MKNKIQVGVIDVVMNDDDTMTIEQGGQKIKYKRVWDEGIEIKDLEVLIINYVSSLKLSDSSGFIAGFINCYSILKPYINDHEKSINLVEDGVMKALLSQRNNK